jgi:hypothetical protein
MNFASFLNREIVRPVATLIAPGTALLAPYFLALLHHHASLRDVAVRDTGAVVAVVLIAALAVGLVLEDLGSQIEAKLWDPALEEFNREHGRVWWQYLALTYETDKEPLGQHYVRTILLRMKFEFSFGLAMFLGLPGAVWLGVASNKVSWHVPLIGCGVMFCLGIYLIKESLDSAGVLSDARQTLVDGPDAVVSRKSKERLKSGKIGLWFCLTRRSRRRAASRPRA